MSDKNEPLFKELGKKYATQIRETIVKSYPNLNPIILDLIEMTASSGFVDGATIASEIIESEESNKIETK